MKRMWRTALSLCLAGALLVPVQAARGADEPDIEKPYEPSGYDTINIDKNNQAVMVLNSDSTSVSRFESSKEDIYEIPIINGNGNLTFSLKKDWHKATGSNVSVVKVPANMFKKYSLIFRNDNSRNIKKQKELSGEKAEKVSVPATDQDEQNKADGADAEKNNEGASGTGEKNQGGSGYAQIIMAAEVIKSNPQVSSGDGQNVDGNLSDGLEDGALLAAVVDLEKGEKGGIYGAVGIDGTRYYLSGPAALSNGAVIQLGNPTDPDDNTQQFGWVKDETGNQYFFSTVENQKLGLTAGQLIYNRDMLIRDEKGNAVLYHFDEDGKSKYVGLLKDLPQEQQVIWKEFKEAGLGNGLPLSAYIPSFTNANSVHNFTYHIEKAATCTEQGRAVKKCTDEGCNMSYTETLAPLGHDWQSPTYSWSGSGESWSCTAQRVCSRDSNHVQTETAQAGSTGYMAPGCTAEGSQTFTANFSQFPSQSKTVSVPALGHDLTQHAGQDATCTEKGWKAYETCSRCSYSTYEEIAALGHDLTQHAGQDATCTEKGWKAYETCSRCSYSTYEEIAALGHDYQKVEDSGWEKTITENGVTYNVWGHKEKCSRCGAVIEVEDGRLEAENAQSE